MDGLTAGSGKWEANSRPEVNSLRWGYSGKVGMMARYLVKSTGTMLEHDDNGAVLAVAVVTECKGSWRWQDAFRLAWYTPRYSTRQRKHFWSVVSHSRKMSGPQLGTDIQLPHGTLHNRAIDADDLQAIGLLREGV